MPGTFVYDEAAKTLYLNGTVQFAGTLYIDHVKDSPEIENSDSSSWVFPSWAHSLLGFYAVAINKVGADGARQPSTSQCNHPAPRGGQ